MAEAAESSSKSRSQKSFCLTAPIFKSKIRVLKPGATYVLGRDADADIHLPDRSVSRHHARVSWVEIGLGGFLIEDLKSVNGLRVGGEKVKQHFLRDGDEISIGSFGLRYRELEGDWSVLLEDADVTRGDTKRLMDQTMPGSRLAGQFEGTELLEVCQLIGQNQKAGALEVSADGLTGSMVFDDGKLVRAEAERDGDEDSLSGLDAARALLNAMSGSFEFRSRPAGPTRRREVPQPIAVRSLLFELMRERDEKLATESSGGFLIADGTENDWLDETQVDD